MVVLVKSGTEIYTVEVSVPVHTKSTVSELCSSTATTTVLYLTFQWIIFSAQNLLVV